MNAVRNVTLAVVLSVVALASANQARADLDDTFAAIAYSPATGHVGYAYNASSQRAAERAALEQCNRVDAEVVVVVRNGYVALAVGEDGAYGYTWGRSQSIAESIVLRKCLEVGGVRPRIVVSIYSGD